MPPPAKYFLGLSLPLALRGKVLDFRAECILPGEEPHITVKAPCGLGVSEGWLEPVRKLCQVFPPIHVRIKGLGNFGSSVLYLKVESPGLVSLHNQLVSALGISLVDQAACFEGPQYVPHLTLLQRQGAELPMGRLAELATKRFEPSSFTANSLTVYKKAGLQPLYEAYHVMSLGGKNSFLSTKMRDNGTA